MKLNTIRDTPSVVWLCLILFAGCVHRHAVAVDPAAGRDATAGAPSQSDAGSMASAADGGGSLGGIACGSAICTSPPFANGFITACCADEATSTCGLAMSGGPCPKPFVGDPRCPAHHFMGIVVVPSCCTERGECGLDGWMYGMPGCVDLATATVRGNTVWPGGEFPKPRACDGAGEEVGTADEDAGS